MKINDVQIEIEKGKEEKKKKKDKSTSTTQGRRQDARGIRILQARKERGVGIDVRVAVVLIYYSTGSMNEEASPLTRKTALGFHRTGFQDLWAGMNA